MDEVPDKVSTLTRDPSQNEITQSEITQESGYTSDSGSTLSVYDSNEILTNTYNTNIVIELDFDGKIKYVSKVWEDVVGTSIDTAIDKPISDFLCDNKDIFTNAMIELKENASVSSASIRCSFYRGPLAIELSPLNLASLHRSIEKLRDKDFKSREKQDYLNKLEKKNDITAIEVKDDIIDDSSKTKENTIEVQKSLDNTNISTVSSTDKSLNYVSIIEMEGQGILIYSRDSTEFSHSMWVLKPYVPPKPLTIDLPSNLVEILGFGAELFASYVSTVAQADKPEDIKAPVILCRICECEFPDWWFERHSALCMVEQKCISAIAVAQDTLNEQRNLIAQIINSRSSATPTSSFSSISSNNTPSSSSTSSSLNPTSTALTEYRGIKLPNNFPVHSSPLRRSATSVSIMTAATYKQRSPLRLLEILLDLCDNALEINSPEISEREKSDEREFRVYSPVSESRIRQITSWNSPYVEDEALKLLSKDTETFAKQKVEAVIRLGNVITYAETIKRETFEIAQQVVDNTIAQVATGGLDDNSKELLNEEFDKNIGMGKGKEIETENENENEKGKEEKMKNENKNENESEIKERKKEKEKEKERISNLKLDTAAKRELSDPFFEPSSPHLNRFIRLKTDSPEIISRGESVSSSNTASPRISHEPFILKSNKKKITNYYSEPENNAPRKSKESEASGFSTPLCSTSNLKPQIPSNFTINSSGNNNFGSPRMISPTRSASGNIQFGSASNSRFNRSSRLSVYADSTNFSPSIFPFDSPTSEPFYHHHHRTSSSTSDAAAKIPVSPLLTAISSPSKPAPPSIRDYEFVKPISRGAFGNVSLAKKKNTGEYVAIKMLKKSDMIAKNQVTNVKAERAIMMAQAESSFVAKLFFTFQNKDYLFLVMEYLPGGDLAALLKIMGILTEDWVRFYIAEVVAGVESLHEKGIVHRDLKPDNILIDASGHLKLTDFGLSRMGLIRRQARISTEELPTPSEVINAGSFIRPLSSAASTSLSTPSDLYSSASPLGAADPPPNSTYFNFVKTGRVDRRPSSRSNRSDSFGGESIMNQLNNFHLGDSRRTSFCPDEDTRSESSTSSDLSIPTHLRGNSRSSTNFSLATVPNTITMHPPQMALFDPNDSTRKFVGTPDYLAPETINGSGQDQMCDWWSIGCIMFEFLYGIPPFHDSSPEKVFDRILSRKIEWPEEIEEYDVSPEANDLIEKLLVLSPNERLGHNGASEIKSHPFFKGVDWDHLNEMTVPFVPSTKGPEDTEYFDHRGSDLKAFPEEFDLSNAAMDKCTPSPTMSEFSQEKAGAVTRQNGIPPHIPTHIRELGSRRVSETGNDDNFGSFSFKNLPVLEKANHEIIERLKSEHLENQRASISLGPLEASSTRSFLQHHGAFQDDSRRLSITSSNSSSGSTLAGRSKSPANSTSPAISRISTGASYNSHAPVFSVTYSGPTSPQLLNNSQDFNTSSSAHSNEKGSLRDVSTINTGSQGGSSGSVTKSPVTSFSTINYQSASMGEPGSKSPRFLRMNAGSSVESPEYIESWRKQRRYTQVFDPSPSSSDNEESRSSRLMAKKNRRISHRESSRRRLGRHRLVLLCDGDEKSRSLLEKTLSEAFCQVVCVNDGAEAIARSTSDIKFDLIITECNLEYTSGEDVARMVKATVNINKDTPIIGVADDLSKVSSKEVFDTVIKKPIGKEHITRLLEIYCGRRSESNEGNSRPQLICPLNTSSSQSGTGEVYSNSSKGSIRAGSESPAVNNGSQYPSTDSLSNQSPKSGSLAPSLLSAWSMPISEESESEKVSQSDSVNESSTI